MRALSPSPVRTACLMHSSLMTGSMPGMAASTSETCELGSPPKAVDAPENNFDCEVTWAWISMPMTTSQSPLAPLIRFDFADGAVIDITQHDIGNGAEAPRASSLDAVPVRHKSAAVPRASVRRRNLDPRQALAP